MSLLQFLDSDDSQVYQGRFGEYTITQQDRIGVLVYRLSLMVGAVCFAIGVGLVLWKGEDPTTIRLITPLYTCFSLALGISLATIHIYMGFLHRLLQLFWAIGALASANLIQQNSEPFPLVIYHQPQSLIGVGFIFVALTGIYFKEAFCFNRLETKFLTPLVPFLLGGHFFGLLFVDQEQFLLGLWAVLFLIFALRKFFQPFPQDIGDKSVFDYLHNKPTVLLTTEENELRQDSE